MKHRILLVDDEPGIRFGFSRYLANTGYETAEASSLTGARKKLLSQRFSAILLDLDLPDGNGLDYIGELNDEHPHMAVIVITGCGDISVAVEAMRRGADNYLTKPVNMEELEVYLGKVLEMRTMKRRCQVRQRLEKREWFYPGSSPAMKQVMEMASVAAENDSAVVLLGETGTGKSLLARWIHEHSSRAAAPFVEVNCSTLQGDLLSSELFGHVKGAFTGAVKDRPGLIEAADGGTLFLDEISEMEPEVQARFLKVIEEKRFRRLGEVKMRRSEFRLVCTTNRELEADIRSGRFRQDLYYRIFVFPIELPPLRERPGDLFGLVSHLNEVLGAPGREVKNGAWKLFKSYPWPGNVRELRNVLERGLLLSRGAALAPEHFPGLRNGSFIPRAAFAATQNGSLTVASGYAPSPGALTNDFPGSSFIGPSRSRPVSVPAPAGLPESASGGIPRVCGTTLKSAEKDHLIATLRRFHGDTRRAAEALGVSRSTLYRKLKKNGISARVDR